MRMLLSYPPHFAQNHSAALRPRVQGFVGTSSHFAPRRLGAEFTGRSPEAPEGRRLVGASLNKRFLSLKQGNLLFEIKLAW